MLFYELVEGKSRVTTHPLVYSHQTVSFTEPHKSPVNVGLIDLTRLLDKRWLTDEVYIHSISPHIYIVIQCMQNVRQYMELVGTTALMVC